jgi:hypothetical protein
VANKIDSNVTGLAFAEEASLKVLPGVAGVDAKWFGLEPNSYSDMGGELTNVARSPINASRQKQKGTITDLDASGGFNTDFTQNNMTRLLQGFFFADAREKPATQPLNGTQIPITATTATQYAAATGLTIFKVGHLVHAKNFGTAANNGMTEVTAVAAGLLTVTRALTVESAPPATAKVEACGFKFPATDVSIVASASSIKMVSAATDLTTLGLTPGEWIFIGGDAAGTYFATNSQGYARIKSISATTIEFSETTFTAVSDVGTAKTIHIYFGTVIRNEKTANLIKRRSYNIERQLGQDAVGTQSEYLIGAIANEFTLNVPQADKLNADLSFVAMDNTFRTGTEGIKAGTRIGIPGEAAYNTSSDIYRLRMNVVDPLTLNNTSLFGYITEMTMVINNNVAPSKAVGVLGAFDASAGDFEVTGSVTAYFTTVSAVQAVRANSDVALNIIAAQDNTGVAFDIPLVSLGGGRLNVEKDVAIMVPLEAAGAENPLGYTMLTTFFPYLPNVGMPA